MVYLPVFNGQETFEKAFKWDHDKIKAFFNRVSNDPTKYGVETRSQTTLGDVCYNISDLIGRSEVYLDDPIEVSYQGTTFTHNTLFDLIGWVFSVTGTSPPNANRSNYYYPLTALYAQFCSIGCGDLSNAPGVVQLTYFQQGSVVRAALGATLISIQPSMDAARKNRFDVMKKAKIVDESERNKSYVVEVNVQTGKQRYKQYFGHCCESWPFLYIDALKNEITLGSAWGWASNTAKYVKENGFEYKELDIDGSLGNACENCQRLIQKINLTLAHFMPKQTTLELEADGEEHPSHANQTL